MRKIRKKAIQKILFSKTFWHRFAAFVLPVAAAISLNGCALNSTKIEPSICLEPTKNDIRCLPSAFDPLTPAELETEWGKELLIGQRFGRDLDLYRAITAFKRALIIMPEMNIRRRLQVEYSIVQSYYYGRKYCEAIQAFEESSFACMASDFPAFHDLLIMIHDCYYKMCEFDKAEKILQVIEKRNSELANDIQISLAINEGNIPCIRNLATSSDKCEPVTGFLNQYCCCSKSPPKAQALNAILPGAGYYYVGQRRAAVTSFITNGLFIAAAYHFFHHGNWAAGLITTSLETGWYIGGINGAGLAAKEYNEKLYNTLGKGMMIRNDLFPLLMLETSF